MIALVLFAVVALALIAVFIATDTAEARRLTRRRRAEEQRRILELLRRKHQ